MPKCVHVDANRGEQIYLENVTVVDDLHYSCLINRWLTAKKTIHTDLKRQLSIISDIIRFKRCKTLHDFRKPLRINQIQYIRYIIDH